MLHKALISIFLNVIYALGNEYISRIFEKSLPPPTKDLTTAQKHLLTIWQAENEGAIPLLFNYSDIRNPKAIPLVWMVLNHFTWTPKCSKLPWFHRQLISAYVWRCLSLWLYLLDMKACRSGVNESSLAFISSPTVSFYAEVVYYSHIESSLPTSSTTVESELLARWTDLLAPSVSHVTRPLLMNCCQVDWTLAF